jgi:Ca2+-transporting ATPase
MKAPWAIPINEVVRQLSVDPEIGLLNSEAQSRLQKFGLNKLEAKKSVSQWQLFLKQLKSPVVYTLVIAAGVSFFLAETLEGWSIVAIIILNAIIGFIQESKAEASIEALEAISEPKAKVLREGNTMTILSEEICQGDILILESGDYVPADARVLTSRQLAANESILTGESFAVDKISDEIPEKALLADRVNMLFASTAISSGTGRAVVTTTGKKTEIGKIADMLDQNKTESTPLQLRLDAVSRKLLWIGIAVIFVVIVIGLYHHRPWMDVLMAALSLSVAAIPEGLPTVVTIALVLAVNRTSRKNALVRKMDSVETLGATDIICTDKTGTLTTGKMKVRETFTIKDGDRSFFMKNMILCNNATLDQGGSGDTTEIALLDFANMDGVDYQGLRSEHPRIYEWAFDSERKRMSVAVKAGEKFLIYCKGAPESILACCKISESDYRKISDKISEYSEKGMRVLGYAWKEIPSVLFEDLPAEEAESNLIFLGLTAMADPPKKESLSAIKTCQKSGIRVIMITGDHPQTASALALELGILSSATEGVLSGKEIDVLSDEELKEVSEVVSVYARVSPANKLKLVSALKSQGHIVAMTGDGVNDAPALKMASIGVAMGKGGTEVARQASSMILTDDNFATIVEAVEEGRAVNGNIKRSLQYLLSTNLAELMFILSAICIGWRIPLLPINILWLNLVTDGLPSLALAAEKVPAHYLEESDGPTGASFFDKPFYIEMFMVALIITFLALGVYHYGLMNHDLLTARSYAFSFLVYSILFRSFSCRSERRTVFQMKPNFYLLASVLVPVLFQLVIPEFEILSAIFKLKHLPLETNAVLLAVSLIPMAFVEALKIGRKGWDSNNFKIIRLKQFNL